MAHSGGRHQRGGSVIGRHAMVGPGVQKSLHDLGTAVDLIRLDLAEEPAAIRGEARDPQGRGTPHISGPDRVLFERPTARRAQVAEDDRGGGDARVRIGSPGEKRLDQSNPAFGVESPRADAAAPFDRPASVRP